MDIHEIRKALRKATLSKDGTAVRGDSVITFVSYQEVRKFLEEHLPEGVSFQVGNIGYAQANSNLVTVSVYYNGEIVYTEDFATSLEHRAMDVISLSTMVRKHLLMSAFDLIAEEAGEEMPTPDKDTFNAMVAHGKEHGYASTMAKALRRYSIPAEMQLKLKKLIEQKAKA